jgi:hypothetical protein
MRSQLVIVYNDYDYLEPRILLINFTIKIKISKTQIFVVFKLIYKNLNCNRYYLMEFRLDALFAKTVENHINLLFLFKHH